MTVLEKFSDRDGSAILGWLSESVLYARFEGTVSVDVGRHFARRLSTLVGDQTGIHYFADSTGVYQYDVLAYAMIVDALLAKREQFSTLIARSWCAPLSERARALLDELGCLELLDSAAEFDARLHAAAPAMRLNEVMMLVEPRVGAAGDARGRMRTPSHGSLRCCRSADALSLGPTEFQYRSDSGS